LNFESQGSCQKSGNSLIWKHLPDVVPYLNWTDG